MKKRVSDPTPQQERLRGDYIYKDVSTSDSDNPNVQKPKPLGQTSKLVEVNKKQNDLLLSVLPKDDLLKLTLKLNRFLADERGVAEDTLRRNENILSIPLSIFSQSLSPLEALVKYMKENLKLRNHAIGNILGRDERGIWITYRNAKRKRDSELQVAQNDFFVPIHIFDDKLSILESLAFYLKAEKELRGADIALLLNKSPSTIWTALNRAKQKKQSLEENKNTVLEDV